MIYLFREIEQSIRSKGKEKRKGKIVVERKRKNPSSCNAVSPSKTRFTRNVFIRAIPQSATSASMIAVDREERLARRQGHEHTPGELWSAATPTSWSSKHRLPRILMDPRRDGSTPSTTLSKSPRRISRAASELHLALSLYPERFVNQSSSLIARLAARHAARTSPFARVKPCYFLLPRDDLIRRGAREAMPSLHEEKRKWRERVWVRERVYDPDEVCLRGRGEIVHHRYVNLRQTGILAFFNPIQFR